MSGKSNEINQGNIGFVHVFIYFGFMFAFYRNPFENILYEDPHDNCREEHVFYHIAIEEFTYNYVVKTYRVFSIHTHEGKRTYVAQCNSNDGGKAVITLLSLRRLLSPLGGESRTIFLELIQVLNKSDGGTQMSEENDQGKLY
jgi:hypothetical protein